MQAKNFDPSYPNLLPLKFIMPGLLFFCLLLYPAAALAFEPTDYQFNFSYDFEFPPIRGLSNNATEAAPLNPPLSTPVSPEQGAGYWSGPIADPVAGPVPECWQKLCEQLVADGFKQEQVEDVFSRLGSCYTESPMRIKLSELYKSKFTKRKKASAADKTNPKTSYYKHVVTTKNLQRAKDFLAEHKAAFDSANKQYDVPAELAVSLILVETDLGNFFGKQKALVNLASMSVSNQPNVLIGHFPAISGNATKEEWMQTVMDNKSSWAYGELKAYLTYCFANNLDPLTPDGSIYGALGYCQFMPSNILLFGVDGNANGTVDLFEVEDAIHSLCNYLKAHGWKKNLDKKQQHAVLLKYNRSNIYANTILLMAENLSAAGEK